MLQCFYYHKNQGEKVNVKQQVLASLERNKGEYISGTDLSNRLNVSRNAVWKAIKSLQDDGYRIDGIKNKGYSLSTKCDIISAQSIAKFLSSDAKLFDIEVHDVVDSTNTQLKVEAGNGTPEGRVIIANEQTSGRGRMNRSFFSPSNTGIYMSILLRPKMTAEESLFLTTAAAVAVAKSIENVSGCDAKIKWVNDIFCNGRKVCGILTEATLDIESGGLQYAVVGIGINIIPPKEDFPSELHGVATSIFDKDGYYVEAKSKLVALILDEFWQYYQNISSRNFLDEYRERSNIIGKEVTVHYANKKERATVLGIDDQCHLTVRTANGEVKSLSSGEVSIREFE